jgi:hypothetical protein
MAPYKLFYTKKMLQVNVFVYDDAQVNVLEGALPAHSPICEAYSFLDGYFGYH